MPSPIRIPRSLRTSVSLLAVAGVVAGLGACTSEADPPEVQRPVTATPDAALTVVGDADDSGASVAMSGSLFRSAPVAVLAPAGDVAAQALGAEAAVALGAPLLVDGAGAVPEIERLGSADVLAVGGVGEAATEGLPESTTVVRADHAADVARLTGAAAEAAPAGDDPAAAVAQAAALTAPADGDGEPASSADPDAGLPRTAPAAALDGAHALATDAASSLAAVATARAAGVGVTVLPAASPDPRSSADAITALHDAQAAHTLAIGAAYADDASLEGRIRTAATGDQLPGGGQLVFPDKRYVALYGAAGTGALGVLGEQGPADAVTRAKAQAAEYQPLSDEPVIPMFELIATVAAGSAGPDGDYSSEVPVETLQPWLDAAREAGVYVVIDLQPGRTDFLTQAKRYESVLAQPGVGLALDPEWRLGPDQVPLKQIGSVSAAEVDATTDWLAGLVRDRGLPQKMLVLHQFRLSMITDRASLDTSHPELAMLIHADGQGGQPDKQATWRALHADAPAGVRWGWKDFIDEDEPMLTPEQTMRDVSPVPDLVTYQ
ncbi:hypothetical protein FGG90_03075 [Clavibacter tessellarius]|uniref:Lipoprotein n=1 Tax=Clavibacter tessellarius TaxID=31965 RepID=A0A225CNJ8_9MICO|nr:hypothetical protein [Clavibacter michiganensis]OQJ63963.1 hypothetical protein B5P24_13640 [Clavibacter michiganensis subsp. tessellarius]UKF33060.1 hypothetical protein FGG90_03075 [Clavibacter michiganensis subsp. tessellarius]